MTKPDTYKVILLKFDLPEGMTHQEAVDLVGRSFNLTDLYWTGFDVTPEGVIPVEGHGCQVDPIVIKKRDIQ